MAETNTDAKEIIEEINAEPAKLWEYITGPELWTSLLEGSLRIILILVLSAIAIKLTAKLVDKLFTNRRRGPIRFSHRREATLKKLIKNVVKYIVYFVAIVMILGVFSLDVGPIIASAGVIGLAVGFGAQNLVRDIISGFFIIFEDQFSVGDYVATSGIEGTVEEIGLRTTKILSWTGEMHILPNGNVTQVTNYSMHNGLAVVDINIPYESDVEEAKQVIDEFGDTLREKYDYILSNPESIGVQSLDASYFALRLTAETEPGMQWAGERAIREELQSLLYTSGIEIPSPRVVMYSTEEKEKLKETQRQLGKKKVKRGN